MKIGMDGSCFASPTFNGHAHYSYLDPASVSDIVFLGYPPPLALGNNHDPYLSPSF